ncbi:hypothetical protein K438DRAFT_1980425 [Mycena galopus ATCC 62051]|nr:hypothetical protein K438DRAFT_1980425 [Mycena galopus ATCC 62051]
MIVSCSTAVPPHRHVSSPYPAAPPRPRCRCNPRTTSSLRLETPFPLPELRARSMRYVGRGSLVCFSLAAIAPAGAHIPLTLPVPDYALSFSPTISNMTRPFAPRRCITHLIRTSPAPRLRSPRGDAHARYRQWLGTWNLFPLDASHLPPTSRRHARVHVAADGG